MEVLQRPGGELATRPIHLGSRLFRIYVWREDWNRKQYHSGVHTGNALSSRQ